MSLDHSAQSGRSPIAERGMDLYDSICFAWFVWDRDHKGPTELHRISWRHQVMGAGR